MTKQLVDIAQVISMIHTYAPTQYSHRVMDACKGCNEDIMLDPLYKSLHGLYEAAYNHYISPLLIGQALDECLKEWVGRLGVLLKEINNDVEIW